MKRISYILIALLFFALGCSGPAGSEPNPNSKDLKAAAESMTADEMLQHIKRLASDEFEGRSPATKGEELTINYLADNFKKLGLKPGNPDGTYFQKVPLISYTPSPEIELTAGGRSIKMNYRDDFVAWTRRLVDNVDLDSDLVFVGYGVTAPEYKWDDFKGQDLHGKILVMLINDPP